MVEVYAAREEKSLSTNYTNSTNEEELEGMKK